MFTHAEYAVRLVNTWSLVTCSTLSLMCFHMSLNELKVPRRCDSFVDHFCCLYFEFVMLSWLIIAALWSPALKGLTSWLFCVVLYFCHFTVWCPGSGVVLDCIDF